MAAYVKNLDEYKSIGTHWIALYVNGDHASAFYDTIYFASSLTVKQIKKKIKKFIGKEIKVYDSIMCKYFSIGFIDFMLKGKSLLDNINLFSLNEYEKNYKIIKYFQ